MILSFINIHLVPQVVLKTSGYSPRMLNGKSCLISILLHKYLCHAVLIGDINEDERCLAIRQFM